jgi:hypothetical protein
MAFFRLGGGQNFLSGPSFAPSRPQGGNKKKKKEMGRAHGSQKTAKLKMKNGRKQLENFIFFSQVST